MPRPRRHRILVEVTDMSGTLSTKKVIGGIESRLCMGYDTHNHVLGRKIFANLQVKSFDRVMAARNRKGK